MTQTSDTSQPQPEYLPGHPGKLAQRPDYLDKPQREITPQYIRTYKLDHCLTCSDAEFYGWAGTAAEKAHAAHLETVDVGPLTGTPCRCPKCTAPPPCPDCRGTGSRQVADPIDLEFVGEEPCARCDGTGRVDDEHAEEALR